LSATWIASPPRISSYVDAWRGGEIEDTPENAEVAIEALALRTALARRHVAAA
jgi:hypothetical protein